MYDGIEYRGFSQKLVEELALYSGVPVWNGLTDDFHPTPTVFWHLDGEYLTATRDFHKVSVSPQPGQHTMTVVDEQGHTLSATIWVHRSF